MSACESVRDRDGTTQVRCRVEKPDKPRSPGAQKRRIRTRLRPLSDSARQYRRPLPATARQRPRPTRRRQRVVAPFARPLRARILKHRRRPNINTRTANVAERLRRQTRNLLGSPRAGSNPAVCGHYLFPFCAIVFPFCDRCQLLPTQEARLASSDGVHEAVMTRAPPCRVLVLVTACLVRTLRGGGHILLAHDAACPTGMS